MDKDNENIHENLVLFLQFFKRNLLLLLIFTSLGFIYGVIILKTTKPVYYSVLILESDITPTPVLVGALQRSHDLARSGAQQTLASLFKMDEPTATALVEVSGKPYSYSDTSKINNFIELKISVYDTLKYNSIRDAVVNYLSGIGAKSGETTSGLSIESEFRYFSVPSNLSSKMVFYNGFVFFVIGLLFAVFLFIRKNALRYGRKQSL